MSDLQIYIILGLSVLTIILVTAVVYLGRRRYLCFYPLFPWCWKDWTCPDELDMNKRCPVLPTQRIAESCLPTGEGKGPGCPNAWPTALATLNLP